MAMNDRNGNMNVVVLMSGGLDSSVLAAHMKHEGFVVHGLGIHYGQRHSGELMAAGKVADKLGIRFQQVWLDPLRRIMQGSSQTDPNIAVPHGHYADESMKVTVVPNRNMLLLACAGALAVSIKGRGIAIAAHAGDHAIYPDCRPEFRDAMARALSLCDYNPLDLFTPFLNSTKADIVKVGAALEKEWDLQFMNLTYSCYEGQEQHCGKCGTCVERKEAFVNAGIADPTVYRA